jgi:hypothetical protein
LRWFVLQISQGYGLLPLIAPKKGERPSFNDPKHFLSFHLMDVFIFITAKVGESVKMLKFIKLI